MPAQQCSHGILPPFYCTTCEKGGPPGKALETFVEQQLHAFSKHSRRYEPYIAARFANKIINAVREQLEND